MDCSRARTRDPLEWIETCPEFSWPLAEQVREWILTWEREYLVWLSTAKRPETRERRLKETLAALSQGLKWAQRKSASGRSLPMPPAT